MSSTTECGDDSLSYGSADKWWVVMVVGWRSCLTQCRMVTEVKHGRARSGVGWVTAQVPDRPIIKATELQLLRAIVPGATH